VTIINKEQNAAQVLERYRSRRKTAIALLGGVCTVCGTDESLEIDHIDPATKSFDLGSQKLERYMAELGKCQLLCTAHHREKTAREQRGRAPHNRGIGHNPLNPLTGRRDHCGCVDCKTRKNERQRKWRASRE
jgi:hypothetical protein